MKRNKFSLSNYKLLTCDMGELVPCGLTEVIPGDSIQQATSALIRVSPLMAPVMHPVHVRIHHWFVPHRLVWEDFEKFITGGPDGLDASVHPTIGDPGQSGFASGSLLDYLGVPTGVDLSSSPISALPVRGYQMIWDEYYRDQDLQTAATISKASGGDTSTDVDLKNVCWEKDYFTTSRPWTQKGAQATIPMSGTAPVHGIGKYNTNYPLSNVQDVYQSGGTRPDYATAANVGDGTAPDDAFYIEQDGTTGYPNIHADLTAGSFTATINDLREAFALQRYAEARAKYGSRYTEYLRYLGVTGADARLDRPEYLGGGKQTIQFSEVLQTGPDSADENVADLKGHGIGALRSNRYRRFFDEHGYIFTFISVLPRTIYADGVPRHFSRTTKEDYFQKELQIIGQQEVKNREVYAAAANPGGTFGFQDRYDEYRRCESTIAGDFRSTLDHWHMARLFGSEPALNEDFVKAVPTKRIHAVQDNDVIWVMANHSIQARRMLIK